MAFIGQACKHKDLNGGKDEFEIVGLRKSEVEVIKKDGLGEPIWIPIKGIILKNNWGHWIDEENDIDFTKNAGPRDF